MTRASDWRFRRSPLLRQQENVPAAADVIVYSAATAIDEAEIVGEVAESIGEVAGGTGRRSSTCRLARLNAALAPHGAAVFEWQAVSLSGQQLHAERDCTARTYECLLPFEYLAGIEEVKGELEATAADAALFARLKRVLRSLLPPKSSTHGGLRGRRSARVRHALM